MFQNFDHRKMNPQSNKCHVTLSKCKLGVFNKVTQLFILCQVKTTMVITSSTYRKLYECSYPNTNTIIENFPVRKKLASTMKN